MPFGQHVEDIWFDEREDGYVEIASTVGLGVIVVTEDDATALIATSAWEAFDPTP